MEKLLIFPFNGNGLEALDCISDKFEFIGYIDDTKEKLGKHNYGFEVFSRDILDKYKEAKVLAIPGSPSSYLIRDNIISTLKIDESRFAKIIHKNASISPLAKVGYNVLIMAGVVITSNAIIGNHICLLPNTVVHHDSEIGDYSLIGSNVTIAGSCKIGRKCYIGSGTSVINNISVGEGTLIGIGTNIIKKVTNHSKMVGNPGRSI